MTDDPSRQSVHAQLLGSLPREQLAAYAAGVQVHVEDLAAYLGGGQRCNAQARWSELFTVYQSKSIDTGQLPRQSGGR